MSALHSTAETMLLHRAGGGVLEASEVLPMSGEGCHRTQPLHFRKDPHKLAVAAPQAASGWEIGHIEAWHIVFAIHW